VPIILIHLYIENIKHTIINNERKVSTNIMISKLLRRKINMAKYLSGYIMDRDMVKHQLAY
jgi:hypothetical protein